MMKSPNLIQADQLVLHGVQSKVDGRWVVGRPMGYSSIFSRFRLAWMVFTGRADALIYIGQ